MESRPCHEYIIVFWITLFNVSRPSFPIFKCEEITEARPYSQGGDRSDPFQKYPWPHIKSTSISVKNYENVEI